MNKKALGIISIACALILLGTDRVLANDNANEDASETRNEDVNETRDENVIETSDEDASETSDEDASENGQTGEQHRSNVAKVAEELIKVAGQDNKIGDEIKTIAQEEKDSGESIKEKMDKIESRGKIVTFLFGSDYKSLGELRSELVTTQNRMSRLAKSLEKVTSTTVKTDLEAQIKELETIKTNAESFVQENESKFSLFGWLVKMFNK